MSDEKLGPVEFGDRLRPGSGTFPEHWGFPQGRMFTAERQRWIEDSIQADARAKTDPVSVLAAKAGRLHVILLAAELERRR